MDHGLDWDDLRTFLLIARHHTLSAAARSIHVQQPTMGRRLDALEQRSGAKLLVKTPTGFVLTEAGARVLGAVERIEQEALTVERLIAGSDVRLEGSIRLATVDTFAAELLGPVLAAFRTAHPDVQVEVIAGNGVLSLTQREADVALRFVPFTQQELAVRKVGSIGFGLYAAPAYLERQGMPEWAAGAAGHHIIQADARLMHVPEMEWFSQLFAQAKTALIANSRFLHRTAARDGLGVACLTRYLGDGFPGLVRIVPPDAAGPPPTREVWMGVHNDMRNTPRIRAFTTALHAGLRDLATRMNPAD